MAEMSLRAVAVGIIIGLLFGAANAYLGLRVGLTVSASIPAAVMSIAVFRSLFRMQLTKTPGTILENNLVQTIGSSGESMAAGIIFTMPALILLGQSPGVLKIFVLGAIGGLLGVLFMIPLRRFLIVREHGKLTYPEGTACAGVLAAGQKGGAMGRLVFTGLGLGAVYEFLVSGVGLWKSAPKWEVPGFPGAEISADASPALLGVGYVIGPRISAIMFGGGALAWLVFIPLIKLFGESELLNPIYPALVPIAEMDPHAIWNNYVRYLGAGAVVFGGFVTMVRSFPIIFSSLRSLFLDLFKPRDPAGGVVPRIDRDLPSPVILGGIAICILAMTVLPRSLVPRDITAALLAVVFSFFFVAVSSRIVGIIGSSSNPISGMTIAALLATTLVFKLLGWTDPGHQAAALAVGAIVCLAAANAGDTSQDLKTGYLVGATPWRMQVGEMVGVLSSAAVIGVVILRLNKAYGLGSEALPAPQATLMTMVVKGVLAGNLPWNLVFIGMAAAAVVEVLGLPSLPFAVGLYLPFSLSTPVMLGGLVRAWVERGQRPAEGPKLSPVTDADGPAAGPEEPLMKERGVLFASGLIAGSAFVGMMIGLLHSIEADPLVNSCMQMGGWASCLAEYPGSTFLEVFRRLPLVFRLGPEWAGGHQDLVAALGLLLAAAVLWFYARGELEEDAPDDDD